MEQEETTTMHNAIKIYTAGEMDNHGNLADWRKELESKLKDIPITWLHPEYNGCDNNGVNLNETVNKDLKLIDRCDLVLAYLNRTELYGTIVELMYVANKKKDICLSVDYYNLLGHADYRDLKPHDYDMEEDYKRVMQTQHSCGCCIDTEDYGYRDFHQYWFLTRCLEKADCLYAWRWNFENIAGLLKEYCTENNFPTTQYDAYINSEEWKKRSTEFKLKNNSDGACALCNDPLGISHLQTHHVRYPKDLKKDNENNWIAICKKCHQKLHGIEMGV